LQSAVSQILNLRAARNAFALEQPDPLPITNRRYSRFKICATSRRRSIRQATGDTVLVRLQVQSLDGLATLFRLQGRYA
jgi:hypothetical protein